MRSARLLTIASALAAFALTGTAGGAAAAPPKKPTSARCPAGTIPVLASKAKGRRPVVRRDRRGRLRCTKLRTRGRPAKPSATPRGQVAQIAESLRTAAALNPAAIAALHRRLGRSRTRKLLNAALDDWRRSAGAASGARAAEGTSGTFGFGSGTKASYAVNVEQVEGAQRGIKADATVEVDVDAAGLEKLAGDKLPKDVKGTKVKVKLTFADLPAACPSAAGDVQGTLRATGSIKVTVQTSGAPFEMELSADVSVRYTAKVGGDARWKTIEDVEVQTEFQSRSSGQSTKTYRGRRLGSGFGRASILSGDISKGIERDSRFIDPDKGGVSGPQGGWNYERGISASDLRTIDNVKAMVSTAFATNLLTYAAMDYLRAVALPRAEKHWYDDEACLQLDASAADSSVKPKAKTKVTARNARAKDGAATSATLSATGTESITPSSASLAANGSEDFTLTAPEKGSAKWTIVGIGPAGKKTVSGSVKVRGVPRAFTGQVRYVAKATFHESTANATVTYTLREQKDGPNGSIFAAYDLTAADVAITDDDLIPGCPTYRYTGSSKKVVFGDLELLLVPDGTTTYAFVVDVTFDGDDVHTPLTAPPMGCPATTNSGVKAFLNARTLTNALRPTTTDGRFLAQNDQNIALNSLGAGRYEASWDLTPQD